MERIKSFDLFEDESIGPPEQKIYSKYYQGPSAWPTVVDALAIISKNQNGNWDGDGDGLVKPSQELVDFIKDNSSDDGLDSSIAGFFTEILKAVKIANSSLYTKLGGESMIRAIEGIQNDYVATHNTDGTKKF